MKIAYIGGGSLFVPSILNGLGWAMRRGALPFEAKVALYDIQPERAERMRAYGDVVREAWHVPVYATVSNSRAGALEGADLVFVSVWLQEEHERLEQVHRSLGFELPEAGPGNAGWAVALAPWTLGVAQDMRRYCPGALLVSLMNPTDVMADVIERGSGIRAAGLCVEPDQMVAELAFHFGVPYESIRIVHGGVNHDGWILRMQVNGQDAYTLWRERWGEIARHPKMHPDNVWIEPIWDLTGYVRTSGHHNWPYNTVKRPDVEHLWPPYRNPRQRKNAALDKALATRTPINDPVGYPDEPPGSHPEYDLMYPYTGISVGKLAQSIATGWAHILSMQVRNQGAISNFPPDVIVEVPTLVQGQTVQPQPVGEMPDWLGGYTRLLAIQRRMIADYVLTRDLATLKHALVTLPMFGTIPQLIQYAEALHEAFSTPEPAS